MISAFIHIRIIDIIDIVLVAVIMYQVYYLIKGTVAFNIFAGILAVLLLYFIVNMLQMKLLSSILGALIGGGAIALIILFQQEIRRFLVVLGTRYFPNRRFTLNTLFGKQGSNSIIFKTDDIYKACLNMASTNTGALIVIAQNNALGLYSETGDIINATISNRLIESIFSKNSPLHDGAIIIDNNKILSARCILPFTNNTELPPSYGMRHRAGLGISETTDAYVIIVSEERGEISIAEHGELISDLTKDELKHLLNQKFAVNDE